MAFTDRIYSVTWSKLVTWLIPAPLRRPKLMAFVNALVLPVVNLFNDYTNFKTFTVYWLGIDSQVCFMEKALNDKYDISLRRIYITDGVQFDPLVLFLKVENKPVTFYKNGEGAAVVLYTKQETAQFTSDFIVFVPMGLPFNKQEMMAVIDGMKLPSKTYIIKRY